MERLSRVKNKVVSVLIPVYNGSKFIEGCVNSILNQVNFDINDIEILLLNDGSKDDSLNVISGLEKKYASIIRVYNHENMGVAKTRNRGIELANGKYTLFIDQDDSIDNDYINAFVSAAEEGDYDVVVGGYRRPDEDGKVLKTVVQNGSEYGARYSISAAWAKIHRTDFLKSNAIHFYDSKYGEDIIFTMQENSSTTKIKGIGYIGYNWLWNRESVSNTGHVGLKYMPHILKLIEDMTPYAKNDMDKYYVVQTAIYCLLYSGRSATKAEFTELYEGMIEIMRKASIYVNRNKFSFIGPRGSAFTTRLVVSAFLILHTTKLVPVFARFYCKG
jgi:glycosyltransferase involved in cell wall biosynthesis